MQPRIASSLLLFALFAPTAVAQSCSGQGSQPVAASCTPGPIALGCAAAPQWPIWHLFTPAHRMPVARPGFGPGPAQALPRVLVAWRCTGWLFVPVVPSSVRTMGYVVDRPEVACGVTP
jgi:hypothetical protein